MKEPSALQSFGERLLMLGRLIEGKSADDTRVVLEWLHRRSREDQDVYRNILRKTGEDSKTLRQWVERRSEEDIDAFQRWFDNR